MKKRVGSFVLFVMTCLCLAPQARAQQGRRPRGTDYIQAASDWVDRQVIMECSMPDPPGYCGGRRDDRRGRNARNDFAEQEAWDDRPYSVRSSSSRGRLEFSLVDQTPFILEVFDGERFLWRLGPREARKVPPPREAYSARALVPNVGGTIQIVEVPATPKVKGNSDTDTTWVFTGVTVWNNTGASVKIVSKRTGAERAVAPDGTTVLFGEPGEFEAWVLLGGRFRRAEFTPTDGGAAITSPQQ